MTLLQGRLITPRGITSGTLHFDELILDVTPEAHLIKNYILPGFVDTHVHGGGGGDAMDGPDGVRTLAQFHLKRGTTTLCPTTMTGPWNSIREALLGIKHVMEESDFLMPSIPGAHLEGPFISPQRLGAQPPFALEPSPERVSEVLELDVVKIVTLAPELPGAPAAARRFAAAGIRVSVGHTIASFEQTQALVRVIRDAGGIVGFTHLYNAMSGLGSREPGAVGAALAEAESYAELIFDNHHVHAGSFLAALNAKTNHLHLITDSIRVCGSGESQTKIGSQEVTVKDGAARLPDGTLSGSVLTLDQALRNVVALGLPLERISELLSETPARYLGLSDRGSLEVGKRADLIVLDEDLNLTEVYVAGRRALGG